MTLHDPEDELLDQSLRETFSDFDLTPASHVWAGVEDRLAALPKARRAVPYKVLLPIIGVVGVGVGWLLPRPEALVATPQTEQRAVLAPLPELLTAPAMPVPPTAPATPVTPTAPAELSVAPARPRTGASPSMREAVVVAARLPEAVAAPVEEMAVVAPVAAADTAATAVPAPQGLPVPVMVADEATVVTEPEVAGGRPLPSGTIRPDASGRERRPEYRVPTHRMAEKGRGFRRRVSHFMQQVRHIVSPKRARTAAHPSF